jgi:hypothetical protein
MRAIVLSLTGFLIAMPAAATAQSSLARQAASTNRSASSVDALIANALSAAPRSVTENATVVGHDGRVLRKGSSDWVCMPDMPDVPNNSPMCLDAPWRSFIESWMHKQPPTVTRMGFGYMLQGDMPVSNVDPFATAPSGNNQWLDNPGPHVMMLVPDTRLLESLPTDPHAGGPYVMWKGTRYAHLMIPMPEPKN